MPSTSKAQQKAMCMAFATRKGKLEKSKLKGAALDIYNSDMTDKQIEDFMVLKESKTLSLKESILRSVKAGAYSIIDEWCKTHLDKTFYSINQNNQIEIKNDAVINLDDKEVPDCIKFAPTSRTIYLNSKKSKKVDLSFLPSWCSVLYLFIKADEISNLITKANYIDFHVDARKYINIVFADNNNGYGCRLTIGDGTSIKELKNMDLDKVYVLCIKDKSEMGLEFESELANKAPMNHSHYLHEPIGDEAKKTFDKIFGKDINKMELTAIRYCNKYEYYKRSDKWYKSKSNIL